MVDRGRQLIDAGQGVRQAHHHCRRLGAVHLLELVQRQRALIRHAAQVWAVGNDAVAHLGIGNHDAGVRVVPAGILQALLQRREQRALAADNRLLVARHATGRQSATPARDDQALCMQGNVERVLKQR